MYFISEKTTQNPDIVGNLLKWAQNSARTNKGKKKILAQKGSWLHQTKVSLSQKELLRLDSFGEGQWLKVYFHHFH